MTHTLNQFNHHHLHHHLSNQIKMSFDHHDPWASLSTNNIDNDNPSSPFAIQNSSPHQPFGSEIRVPHPCLQDPPSNPPQKISIQPLIRSHSTSASHPLKSPLSSPLPSNDKLPSPVHPLSDATRPALKRLTADHPPPLPASSPRIWFARQHSPLPLSPIGNQPALSSTPLAENPIRIMGERDVLLHQVNKHDTLPGIALSYGISLSALRKANGMWPSDPLSLKSTLRIPLAQCSLPPAKRIGIGAAGEAGVMWDDCSRSSGSRSSAAHGGAASMATWAGSGASSERGRSEDSASGRPHTPGEPRARVSALVAPPEPDDRAAGPSTLRQRAPPARTRRTPEAARRPPTEPLQLGGLGPVDGPESSPGLEKKRLIQRAFSGTQRPHLGLDNHDTSHPTTPQPTTTTMGSKWTTVRPGKPPPLSKQLKFLEDSATGTTNKLGLALQQALDGLFAPGAQQTCSPGSNSANGRLLELDQIDGGGGMRQNLQSRRSCTGGAGGGLWEVWNEVVGSKTFGSGHTRNTSNLVAPDDDDLGNRGGGGGGRDVEE